MKTIDWYFDFISPFSYFQAEKLHLLPDDVSVHYRPILFAGLLTHWGHKGPAEIPSKRRFTYRHTLWTARREGIPLKMPPAHPFNPLPPLRLAIALDNKPKAVKHIFRFIWRDGNNTDDPNDWARLADELGVEDIASAIATPEVKNTLRTNTEEAVANGVFGVPTFCIDDELFWGFDAFQMALDYLADPTLLQDPEMQRVSDLPATIQRK